MVGLDVEAKRLHNRIFNIHFVWYNFVNKSILKYGGFFMFNKYGKSESVVTLGVLK